MGSVGPGVHYSPFNHLSVDVLSLISVFFNAESLPGAVHFILSLSSFDLVELVYPKDLLILPSFSAKSHNCDPQCNSVMVKFLITHLVQDYDGWYCAGPL